MTKNRKIATVLAFLAGATVLAGCESAADTANSNLSKAAENFEVPRRIVGINGITDSVLFMVEGFCSYETPGNVVEVICLTDRATGEVMRTTLGTADNVTFVSTQLQGVEVDLFKPRVIFRPETIVPDVELSTSLGDLGAN